MTFLRGSEGKRGHHLRGPKQAARQCLTVPGSTRLSLIRWARPYRVRVCAKQPELLELSANPNPSSHL